MPYEMLKLHWKASRWLLLPLVLGAFLIPFTTWTGGPMTNLIGQPGIGYFSHSAQMAAFYPALAALAGMILALTAWNWDHQKAHVYPLSLPISRTRYSVLKFGSGVVLLLLPTIVLGLTALGVSNLVDLPAGLRSYPLELTGRFFLAGTTAYAFWFALASGTIRTTVLLIVGLVLFLFLADPLTEFVAGVVPRLEGVNPSRSFLHFMTADWGPLRVFVGNWMLIDV